MSQILAIFRKDVRHLWPQIAIYLALLALATLLDPTYTNHGSPSYVLLSSLLPLAAWALLIAVIYEEKLPGDRQDWLTRPLGWQNLVAAKALFVVTMINLPMLVSHIAVLTSVGIPLPESFPALFWRQVFFSAFYLLPVAALASMTPNFGQLLVTALLVLLPYAVAQSFFISRLGLAPTGFEWILTSALAVVLASAAFAILVIQYSSRRIGRARVVAAGGLTLALTLTLVFHNRATARRLPETAGVRISLDPERGRPAKPQPNGRNTIALEIPVRVEGRLPQDAQLMKNRIVLDIQASGAGSWSSLNAEGGLHDVAMGRGWQTILVDRDYFLAVRNRPVNLSGSLDFTLFGDLQALPVPRDHDVVVPGLGVCSSAVDSANWTSIVCYLPFPRASLYLGTPGGGANWIVPQGFVGAPIPTEAGFQILTKFSSQLPFAWKDISGAHLMTSRPMGRLHLPFLFRDIRLADYAAAR